MDIDILGRVQKAYNEIVKVGDMEIPTIQKKQKLFLDMYLNQSNLKSLPSEDRQKILKRASL